MGSHRFRALAFVIGISLACLFPPQTARADGEYGPDPYTAPTVFSYGFRGFAVGALLGTGGGYIAARRDGWEGDDWKPIAYGIGIGALSGSVLGLTLGILDLADDKPGVWNLALRDMVYGAGFGVVAGAITGGLVVIKSRDGEHVLFGAAIGTLAGSAIGLAIGIFEGRRILSSPRHRESATTARRLEPTLSSIRDQRGSLVWLPGLAGRF